MRIYKLHRKQLINISPEKAWDFFSSPENLKLITPDYMGFFIVGGAEKKMYAGQIINYIVKPLLGIPVRWVTEITHVNAPYFFVDEQRFGPYKFWHHKHFINSGEAGTELEDIVHYALPFGFLGSIVHRLFVRKKVQSIFDYRTKKIRELFS